MSIAYAGIRLRGELGRDRGQGDSGPIQHFEGLCLTAVTRGKNQSKLESEGGWRAGGVRYGLSSSGAGLVGLGGGCREA